MLKSLTLKNFQAHESTIFCFDSKVTTIVGPSDKGKSAIIRALKWVVFNRPGGDEFIRYGTKEARVTLEVNDTIIKRIKGKQNKYFLEDKEFKAFGNDVPPEIVKTINLGEVNFQGQYDLPFWFGETAGEVSRQLNQIVNLSIIDTTLANLVSRLRENKSLLTIVDDRCKEAKQEREALKYTRQMKKDMEELTEKHNEMEDFVQKTEGLKSCVDNIKSYQNTLVNCQEKAKAGQIVIKAGDEFIDAYEERWDLEGEIDDIKILTEKANKKVPNFKPLEKASERLDNAYEDRVKLSAQIMIIENCKEEVESRKQYVVEFEKELKKWKGTECPLCNQKMK